MKKPRKPKPKAKRRAPSPAIAPRRTLAPAQRARHAGRAQRHTSLASIGRRHLSAIRSSGTASARRGWSELARLAQRISAGELRSTFENSRTPPRTIALPYSRDERQVLLLLFLPILLVASALVAHQSMRTLYDYVTLAAIVGPDREVASIRPGIAKTGLPPAAELPEPAARPAIARETAMPATAVRLLAGTPETEAPNPTAPTVPAVAQAGYADARQVATPADLAPVPRNLSSIPETKAPATAALPSEPPTTVAFLNPAPVAGLRQPSVVPAPIEAFEADDSGQPILPGICTVADAERNAPVMTGTLPVSTAAPVSLSPEAFGLRLAEAAEAQTTVFVVYNDTYRSIAYPMGDVHHMFGVCTDVVVRAYRALGLDLQALVHQTRSGRGDRNIDHRRTEVLRRFFAAHGESLPVSPFAEDYRPGDIVTYHRPQNRGSRSHIAIVSSEIAPSGRPMIVHNRGWGPQLEDALFVDRITGHYRYRGPMPVQEARAPERAAPSISPVAGIAAAALPVFLPAPGN
ncbi:hypothetical protein W911_03810 [Hyphomicrobium nitrativorans NL23]|uniref:DUF1287 domain-containing protein n=1 Tax=Hyphomicrobium nitrativorans NL23 TaxID=1029756 RepID=V5SCM8_9HYPH|nr:DUF1287 domain-containing protein [Hyphomicrobium nitrativorans]AHB47724.1 hypothetical protein W911_03810 [Hyphomicrobium nitrativorans NL23]